MIDEFLRTDERLDVICSLQMTIRTLRQVRKNSHYWKWVILSLHSAIQGAMVCHLSGTANYGGCTKKSVTKRLKWHQKKEGEPTKLRLEVPQNLFKRLSDPTLRVETNVGKLIVTDKTQKDAFDLLCELRNPFTHFQPMGWSIEIAGLPNMVRHNIELLEMISKDAWPFRHASTEELDELAAVLKKIKSELIQWG